MVFANVTYYYFASTRGAKCCDEHVRVSACLSASTSPEQHKISPNFYAIARLSSGGVLNLRYITSCFMDDVMLTHNGQEYATRKRSTDTQGDWTGGSSELQAKSCHVLCIVISTKTWTSLHCIRNLQWCQFSKQIFSFSVQLLFKFSYLRN